MQSKQLTEVELSSVNGLSDREAALVLGVGKSTVNKYRNKLGWNKIPDVQTAEGVTFAKAEDGTATMSVTRSDAPVTLEEVTQALRDQSIDLSAHSVSYGFSERELANGEKRYTYTVKAVPKKLTNPVEQLDVNDLLDSLEHYSFTPVIKVEHEETFVITPSDMQIGKTSFNGGTAETIERVRESFSKAKEFVKDFKPASILIAELGDPLENFNSTSSQRETNDLDLTGQIRVARRLLLEGIKELAPYARRVTYAAVPSNHGSVRVGFKAPAGDNHNDYGLSILDQIEDAVRENSSLDHVEFVKPEHLYESMMIETSGTKIGMVHGHQSRSADKIGEWWKGQDHGRQPTADADILLVGHWHSFRIVQSGSGRWVMVSPASDPGSDWFTNITGEFSETGMLSFTTSNGHWDNLRIL